MCHKMHTAIHVCDDRFLAAFPQNLNKDYEWFVHTQPTEKQVEEVKYASIYIYIYIYIYTYDYVRVTIFIQLLIRMS